MNKARIILLAATVSIVCCICVPRPVSALEFGFAPTDACLDPSGNTCSKNNMPVGSTIRVMLWFATSDNCLSANINWGDGNIDYGVSDGDTIVFTEHTFRKSGSFQCVATTTCGSGRSASISVTVTGGFGGGSDSSVAAQSLGLAVGVMGIAGTIFIQKSSLRRRRPRRTPTRKSPVTRKYVANKSQRTTSTPGEVRTTFPPGEVTTTFPQEAPQFITPETAGGISEGGVGVTIISLNEGTNYVANEATKRRIDNNGGCNVQQPDCKYRVEVQGKWDQNPWNQWDPESGSGDYKIENPRTDGFDIIFMKPAPVDAMIDWKIIRL